MSDQEAEIEPSNRIEIRKMATRNEVKGLMIDPRVPQPNFRMLMIAPSFTGKSNLILNLLIDHYSEMKVYIFSKSFHNDSIWDNVEIDDEFVFDTISEEIIEPIFKEQERLKQKFKNDLAKVPKLLFIIDDMVNDIKDSKADIISKLFFRGRHLVLSTIMTSQSYNAVPKMIRTNASHLVFFTQASAKEVKTISEENAFGGITQKDFLKLFVHATESEPFSFLYIDRKVVDNSLKFRKRFDTSITVQGDSVVEQDISPRLQKGAKMVVEDEQPEAFVLNQAVKARKKKKKDGELKKKIDNENRVLEEILSRNKRLESMLFG